jgi:hypothetical protein
MLAPVLKMGKLYRECPAVTEHRMHLRDCMVTAVSDLEGLGQDGFSIEDRTPRFLGNRDEILALPAKPTDFSHS